MGGPGSSTSTEIKKNHGFFEQDRTAETCNSRAQKGEVGQPGLHRKTVTNEYTNENKKPHKQIRGWQDGSTGKVTNSTTVTTNDHMAKK